MTYSRNHCERLDVISLIETGVERCGRVCFDKDNTITSVERERERKRTMREGSSINAREREREGCLPSIRTTQSRRLNE